MRRVFDLPNIRGMFDMREQVKEKNEGEEEGGLVRERKRELRKKGGKGIRLQFLHTDKL